MAFTAIGSARRKAFNSVILRCAIAHRRQPGGL